MSSDRRVLRSCMVWRSPATHLFGALRRTDKLSQNSITCPWDRWAWWFRAAIIWRNNQRWIGVVFYSQQDVTNAACAQYSTQTSMQTAQVHLPRLSLAYNTVWQRIDGWLWPCLLILISIRACLLGTNRVPSTVQYIVATTGPEASIPSIYHREN